jgi:hypothetical protein
MESIAKTYKVSLKMAVSDRGVFESIVINRGRSGLDEDLLERINTALQSSLVPAKPVRTTVAIGDDAEQKVMNHLLQISQCNSDFIVSDTSNMLNHGDMMVEHMGKRVCIEVKCYTKPVPSKEIEKYRMSLGHTEYSCGIMIQMEPCGFAKECGIKTPIDFKIEDGKPSMYLTNIDLSILYPVISMMISYDGGITGGADELEKKRAALLGIHERVLGIRTIIAQQKRLIQRMEDSVDEIVEMSMV